MPSTIIFESIGESPKIFTFLIDLLINFFSFNVSKLTTFMPFKFLMFTSLKLLLTLDEKPNLGNLI